MSESALRVSAQGWTSAQRLAGENRLFAILDACDAPLVPEKANELGLEKALSLYLGLLDASHWPISPYLFRVDPDVLAWLIANLKQQPWGIFAVPHAPDQTVKTLFAHFRKFVIIRAGDEQVYFRFYDPRVLPKYLERVPEEKLEEFFGPCGFLASPAGSDKLNWFWLEQTQAPALP